MSKDKHKKIPFISLIPFLLISFGLAWGILGMYIAFPEKMSNIFGNLTGQHPLFFICVYAPAIAAFVIVLYYTKIKGFKAFISRFLIWRCSPLWYFFIFIIIPVIFISGSYIKGNLFTEPFPFKSFSALVTALFFAAVKGPIEEFGWRGFALPLLQRKLAPLWSAIILGIIWGVWHLPAFFLSGTQQSNWNFAPFFAGCVAISVIAGLLFNSSRGSILLAALFHFNLMNPIFPDAAPYDTYMLAVAAVIMVYIKRKKVLNKKDSIVDIIPLNKKE
jgi:membrane protease YdiL (CAAX protease family)